MSLYHAPEFVITIPPAASVKAGKFVPFQTPVEFVEFERKNRSVLSDG